jgi:hypothetical protein
MAEGRLKRSLQHQRPSLGGHRRARANDLERLLRWSITCLPYDLETLTSWNRGSAEGRAQQAHSQLTMPHAAQH